MFGLWRTMMDQQTFTRFTELNNEIENFRGELKECSKDIRTVRNDVKKLMKKRQDLKKLMKKRLDIKKDLTDAYNDKRCLKNSAVYQRQKMLGKRLAQQWMKSSRVPIGWETPVSTSASSTPGAEGKCSNDSSMSSTGASSSSENVD